MEQKSQGEVPEGNGGGNRGFIRTKDLFSLRRKGEDKPAPWHRVDVAVVKSHHDPVSRSPPPLRGNRIKEALPLAPEDMRTPAAPKEQAPHETSPELRQKRIPTFDDYKLETGFEGDYIVHTTHKWELSARVWEKSIWKQQKMIGDGGFGSVWLQKGQYGQLRAVKKLARRSLVGGSFSQELLALTKLKDYDYLFVKFFGWYENNDHIFLAMEYVEFGDLGGYMLRDPLKAKADAKEITVQILKGLEILHKKKICHRDLKPPNILISCLNPIRVKIADFGISKWTKGTAARTLCGTQGYLAPELLGALPRGFKTRELLPHALDIWSLGSLVHELLTSQTPFFVFDEQYDSESGLAIESTIGGEMDMNALLEYCNGTIQFPIQILQESQVSEEGIDFVKSLLIPRPKHRPTATSALQSPWLKEHTNCAFSSSDGLSIPKTQNQSILMDAITDGGSLIIPVLLESQNIELLDSVTRGKFFQLASNTKQLDTLELLLHHRVDFGARIENQSVLQWATNVGHINTVSLLLKYEVSTSTNCLKAFRLAVKMGNLDMAAVFLDINIDIDGRLCKLDSCSDLPDDDDEYTALQVAAGNGDLDMVKLLIYNNANMNASPGAETSKGRSALQAAAEGGHTNIVRLLLNNRLDVRARVDGPAARNNKVQTALQAAAGGGHIETVRLLLLYGANANADIAKDGGRTALQAAAGGGYFGIVNRLLSAGADVNDKVALYHGRTALQAAAEGGHIEICELLLCAGADVNAQAGHQYGRTALQAAAGGGHIETVKLLLEDGASVDSGTARHYGQTALQAAAEGGHIDIVKLLLDNKADVNSAITTESGGLTALQAAAGGGHAEIVKLLLERKADVGVIVEGRTALQLAAEGGHIDIVKLLLDNHASINDDAAERYGRTALIAAAERGHIDIVKLLLDSGANVNTATQVVHGSQNQTALQAAVSSGNTTIVKLLLDNKADVNFPVVEYGKTALQIAAGCGNIEICKLLLENGADTNLAAAQFDGRTALQAAVEFGNTDVIKLLLDNKADINATTQYEGLTALRLAAGSRNIDVVRLLLDNGASVDGPMGGHRISRTPLQAAAESGHIGIVRLLLDSGANVNIGPTMHLGRTALQAASEGGWIDIVKLLLDNNADVNADAAIVGGRTALQAAAEGGHIDITKLLLDRKADVNAKRSPRNGRTALQAAAKSGYIDIFKLLLENGADVNTPPEETEYTTGDRTALQTAAQCGHADMVQLLVEKGADVNAEASRYEGRTALCPEVLHENPRIFRILSDAISTVASGDSIPYAPSGDVSSTASWRWPLTYFTKRRFP